MTKQRKGDINVETDPDGNFMDNGDSVLVPEVLEAEVIPESTPETEKLRADIKQLTSSISNCYWELSTLVHKVSKEKLYKTWGFSDFSIWASEELGFQKRKAYYLVQFQDYCQKDLKELLPVEEYKDVVDQLKDIGWTKALEIIKSKALNKETCAQILEAAHTDQIDELVDKLKLIKGCNDPEDKGDGSTSNTMKKVKRSFSLTTVQEEILQGAIEKAKTSINRDDVSAEFALEYLCADFTATSGGDLQASLSNLERLHGISLVAFSGTNEIVFGNDTLNAMIEFLSKEDVIEGTIVDEATAINEAPLEQM